MEQNSQSVSTEHKRHSAEKPLVEVEGIFKAPIERVWKAFADAETLRLWWGPENFTCPIAKSDFQVGGKYLYAMKDQGGKVIWSAGNFLQIVPDEKIVYTDQFSDEKGNYISGEEADMGSGWPMTLYVTIELERVSDKETKIMLSHEGIPAKWHNDCEDGWTSSFEKLQQVVERR